MLILGIDDAGRGPVIGPMILSGVLLTKAQDLELKKLGVRDSKMLSQNQRLILAKEISKLSKSHTIVTEPKEIDSGINLNTLEAQKAAEIINKLNSGSKHSQKIQVIVDCPSVNTETWKAKLIEFISYTKNLKIKCEHKADANYPSVSAASILAKVEREAQITELKKRYGDFGSGYPSDPSTKKFLKDHGAKLSDSGIFRKSWQTWKKMYPAPKDKMQKTLENYRSGEINS